MILIIQGHGDIVHGMINQIIISHLEENMWLKIKQKYHGLLLWKILHVVVIINGRIKINI